MFPGKQSVASGYSITEGQKLFYADNVDSYRHKITASLMVDALKKIDQFFWRDPNTSRRR
jgi:hypothetical protein